MAYCRKCGAKLKDDDVFCYMCGESVNIETDSVSSPTSKEESIALAENLKAEFSALEKLQKEIVDNQTRLGRPVVYNDRRYSAFRFFWPFLIYAYLALNVIYIIGAVISASNQDQGGMVLGFFIGLAAAAGLLIYGGSYAGNKRDRLNKEISDEEYQKRKRYKELAERTNVLITRLNNRKIDNLELVPVQFRTKHHMERVIALLQSDRAANFSEALKMLEN